MRPESVWALWAFGGGWRTGAGVGRQGEVGRVGPRQPHRAMPLKPRVEQFGTAVLWQGREIRPGEPESTVQVGRVQVREGGQHVHWGRRGRVAGQGPMGEGAEVKLMSVSRKETGDWLRGGESPEGRLS